MLNKCERADRGLPLSEGCSPDVTVMPLSMLRGMITMSRDKEEIKKKKRFITYSTHEHYEAQEPSHYDLFEMTGGN